MPAVEYVHCHKGYESTTTSDNSAAAPPIKELYHHRRHFQRRVPRQRPQKLRRRRRIYRLDQPVSCPNYCIASDIASNTSDEHSVCPYVDQRRKRSVVPSVPAFRYFKICPSRSRPMHVCVPVYNQPEPPRLRLKSSGCRRSTMLHHPCCTQSRGMCSVVSASRHSGGVVIPDELQAQYDALMQHYAIRNQCNSTSRIKSSAKLSQPPKECPAERAPPTPDSGRTECRRKFACPCPCPCRSQQSSRQFMALTESLLACLDADSPVSGKDRQQRPPETSAVEQDSLNEDRGPCRESEVFNTASKIIDSNQQNSACTKETKEWNESRFSPFSNSEMFHYKTYEPNTESSNTKTLPNDNIDRYVPKNSCATPSFTIQRMTDLRNDLSFLDQIVGTKNCGRVTPPTAHDDSSSAVFPVKQPKNISLFQNGNFNNVEIDNHSKGDTKPYEKLISVSRDDQPQDEQNDNCVLHSESGTTSNQTIIDTKKLAQRLKVSSERSSRLSLSPCRNESTFVHDERIASWNCSSRSQASNVTKNLDGCSKTMPVNSPSNTYREFVMEDHKLQIPDSADDSASKISSKLTKHSSRANSRQNSSRDKTSFKDTFSSILFPGIDKLTETNEQAAKLIDRTVTAHLCDREKQSFVSNNFMSNPQSDATESGSRSISFSESFNRRSLPHSPVAQLTMSADLTSEGPKFRKILKKMQLEHIAHMENDLKRLKDIARSLDIITED